MIGSNAFNYINVLNKAADASWIRNEVIANNIANVSTPHYKRKDIKFEDYLKGEIKKDMYGGGDPSASTSMLPAALPMLTSRGSQPRSIPISRNLHIVSTATMSTLTRKTRIWHRTRSSIIHYWTQ